MDAGFHVALRLSLANVKAMNGIIPAFQRAKRRRLVSRMTTSLEKTLRAADIWG